MSNLIDIYDDAIPIKMENDKDIKIETDEEVGLDDKIKAGARALGKKIEDMESFWLALIIQNVETQKN